MMTTEAIADTEYTQNIRQMLMREAVIRFRKANGEERSMRCTKDLTKIPEDSHPKGVGQTSDSEQVCCVWDLDKQAWRSFRYDSIIQAMG